MTTRLSDIRATWHLAWPIAIGQLATTGTAFIDAVMAGHVSAGDLAAVSVGSSIWVTMMVTLMGFLLAISPLVAQKIGANDLKPIANLTQQALVQALILALIGLVLIRFLLPIFNHLGLEAVVAHKAGEFLKAVSWGLPAFACYRVLYCYSAALNQTKPMMVISIFCLLLNIPCNWVLIYGHWGFPAMGGVGCGWATAFCVWVNFLLLAAWIRYAHVYKNTHPFRAWQSIDWHAQKQLLKLGLPIGMMFFVEVSAFSLIGLLIASLGTVTVAAHQITLNFSSLTFMVPMALGTALTVRVGHAIGAGDYKAARFIGQTGIRMGLCIALLTGTTMIFASRLIAGFYTSDTVVLMLASQLLVLAGFFQFSDATQVVVAGVLRGYKSTRGPMLIHLTAFWVIGIPLGYLLTFGTSTLPGYGVQGYWIALVAALTCAALSLMALFRRVSLKQLEI